MSDADLEFAYLQVQQSQTAIAVRAAKCVAAGTPRVLFPGSFDPVHDGHWQMSQLASDRLGSRAHFELSIENVDKAPLSLEEVRRRVEPLHEETVWLTRAPTFAQKSVLFPECTFVVGADTLIRIADVNYYENIGDRDDSLTQIASYGCRFLAFGRVDSEGSFRSGGQSDLPLTLRKITSWVDEQSFRADISSSEIRDQSRKPNAGR